MLTPRKPGAARRAAAAAALALAITACVTRVEPPVVVTDSEPSADAAEESASGKSSTVFLLPFLGRTPKRAKRGMARAKALTEQERSDIQLGFPCSSRATFSLTSKVENCGASRISAHQAP